MRKFFILVMLFVTCFSNSYSEQDAPVNGNLKTFQWLLENRPKRHEVDINQAFALTERKLEKVMFEMVNNQLRAFFILSDGTVWQKEYTLYDEASLSKWEKGDQVFIRVAEGKQGYTLNNIQKKTSFDVASTIESNNLFPTIVKKETKPVWPDNNPGYKYTYFTLSDHTRWKVFTQDNVRDWDVGDRVIVTSDANQKFSIVNLELQFKNNSDYREFYTVYFIFKYV